MYSRRRTKAGGATTYGSRSLICLFTTER